MRPTEVRKNVRIKCPDGLPYDAEIFIDNKLLGDIVIARYKETPEEKRLIVVTCDQNACEHQVFYSDKEANFNFELYNTDKKLKVTVENSNTKVVYDGKDLTDSIHGLLWQVEIPDIASIELSFM